MIHRVPGLETLLLDNFSAQLQFDDFGALKQPGFENPNHLRGGGVGSSIESPRSLWVVNETVGLRPLSTSIGLPGAWQPS